MHVLVTDSQTDEILIDGTLKGEGEKHALQNKDAVGTHLGTNTVHGPVYQGVKVWVAPRSRVYDWEPEGPSVFVQWTDKSNSKDPTFKHERVHTVERPLPGGAIGRFLVAVG